MTTYSPPSIAELSDCLRQAHRDRLKVRVVGGDETQRSEMTDVDIVISLAALGAPVEHEAGDLIATLPAGLTLGAANAQLQREGQWLPLDPPGSEHITIGAVVATNASGPRRHRFGSPRDLIIGVELALSDGRLVKSGGRVVKNVAGYDLARMMCGSYGSLAIVTSATFKLSPLPAASRTVAISMKDTRALGEIIQLIAAAPFMPTAVDLISPPHRLLVRFETTAAAAREQARSLAEMCERTGTATAILADGAEHELWNGYERAIWRFPGTLLRVSVLPSRVAEAVDRTLETATAAGIECRLGGRAGLGVLHARLEGSDDAMQKVIERVRQWVSGQGGSTVVEGRSARTNNWGPMGDSWPLMQAVKARFDPFHLLNPGGGPGGL